jgi:hypothetical protein
MKHRHILLIAGLAAILAATGCAQQTKENTTTTEAQEELIATNTQETAAENEEPEVNEEAEVISEAPVHIWGTITGVSNTELTVDNQSENSSSGEIILAFDAEQTVLVDAVNGLPLTMEEIVPGTGFEAYLGQAMTMSLPPITNPYLIIGNIAEGANVPQYAIAAEDLSQEDGYRTLTATDGRTYQLPEDVEVTPYLTRNIVTLDDITQGSKVLIWLNENSQAEKVVVFPE